MGEQTVIFNLWISLHETPLEFAEPRILRLGKTARVGVQAFKLNTDRKVINLWFA